ncbi:Pentatricopeptide repeat-containing protein [Ranunculus cassubicifolius]
MHGTALNSLTSLHPPSPSIETEIKTCKTMKDLVQFHAKAIKTNQIQDPIVSAEILRFCALSAQPNLKYAHSVFNQMKNPNCFSWNTIIRAYTESENQSLEALIIFIRMLKDEFVQPNRFTYPSVLKACRGLDEGKQIHGRVIKCGGELSCDDFVVSNLVRMYSVCGDMDDARRLFEKKCVFGGNQEVLGDGNVVLWNVMIDGYVRNGELVDARELFDEMPQRSIVSWNGMIAGYAQNGFFKEAVEVYREMQMRDECPNYVTLVSVLPAISRLGALELGKWVHLYAEKNDIKLDDVLGSALIDMYSKCGSIEKALQVFKRVRRRNVITWNAIIGGLAMHGRAKEALDYFSSMEKSGVKPSDVSFIGVLTACSHAGLVEEGRAYFDYMVNELSLRPRIEHYGCMVDLFGRAGLLEEAENLILSMPLKADDVIWKALLGACRIRGNIEMGKRVARQLLKLAPHDSGCYVALSNMYASLGKWQSVAETRLRMKELNIKKDPGCSWIELDGAINEFFVEDGSQPRSQEIHLMLEEMSEKLRLSGYKRDTTQVLLNIDEEEKESALNYHSEKVALAFGLINTSRKTSLQIVKNLRICVDCHASMKQFSKIYDRRIVVRDRSRFHHFVDGSCSCLDYW